VTALLASRTWRGAGEVPLWSIGAVFALVGLLAYLGLNTYLRDQTLRTLAPYSQVVKLGPQSATLTISLP